jgi:processive 1,2-diacylglycerol beta-glucosyltransferase
MTSTARSPRPAPGRSPAARMGQPEPAGCRGPAAAHALPSPYPAALVLSGSLGRGHDVVAQVCAEALTAAGLVTSTYDCMSLLGGWRGRLAEASFRWLLSRPALYDAFHFSQLRAGGRLARHGDRAAGRRIADRLERQIPALGAATPPAAALGARQIRLVLSVFATGAAVGSELARRHPALRAVVFCTDATAHSMWVHDQTDLFVATSPLAAQTIRRYRPSAEVQVVPPPVRAAFYAPPPQRQIRAQLGVREGAACVLLTAGGWGLAPLARYAEALAGAGLEVLAVAGSNDRLARKLEALAATRPNVRTFGVTDRMHELMAAADVVVAGPGQTCHEARAVGRPLVVLDVVPGHGRENLLHELTLGGARACSPDPDAVRAAVLAVSQAPPELPGWPVRSAAQWQQMFLQAVDPAIKDR